MPHTGGSRDIPSPSFNRRRAQDGLPLYARLPLVAPTESPAMAALQAGQVLHSDLAVLSAITLHMEWVAGRCWASLEQLAEVAVMSTAEVEAAAARLLQAQVVAIGQVRDSPFLWFWRVHPLVAAHGGPGRGERACWAGWQEAVAGGWQRPPGPGDLTGWRPRRVAEVARKRASRAAARAAMEAALTEQAERPTGPTTRRRRSPRSAAPAPQAEQQVAAA